MKVLLVDQIAKVNYKYTYSLANGLKEKDVDVELAIDLKSEEDGCSCKKYNLFNTDEKGVGKLKKGLNYIASWEKIKSILRGERYDVFHSQWVIFSPVDYYFLKSIKRHKIKLIVTVHDILPFNEKFYDKFFHKKIYELADEIIVQADTNVERFKMLFPHLSDKVHMIPHGHFMNYCEKMDKTEARKSLNLGSEKFVYLFFGQIKKVKGVANLIKAFANIKDECEDSLLVIAGSVWKDTFEQYQSLIDEREMNDRVMTHIRYIPDEDIKKYYSACDVSVLPYTDVYQSGVIQLSYAYEKPAVATRLPAFTDIVEDEKNGFLADVADVDTLADAMKRAYKQKDKLVDMGQIGNRKVCEKFSWEKIAEDVKKLYQ